MEHTLQLNIEPWLDQSFIHDSDFSGSGEYGWIPWNMSTIVLTATAFLEISICKPYNLYLVLVGNHSVLW